MPASSIANDNTPRIKRCAHCSGENVLGAADCVHCGAQFPTRQMSFLACAQCGGFNPSAAEDCQHCGTKVRANYPITLIEVARDGVFARGLLIDEEEVREAEAQAPAIRARLARVDDQTVARILRSIPIECYPALGRLFANIGDPEEGDASNDQDEAA